MTAVVAATGAATFGDIDADAATDLLWATARQQDRLEHVTVRACPGRLVIGLFHLASTQDHAGQLAHRLCLRVIGSSPRLHGWAYRRFPPPAAHPPAPPAHFLDHP